MAPAGWQMLVALALAAGLAPGLDPAARQAHGVAPAEPETAPRTVRLDAIVTDRRGTPLLDLKASDIDVVEDGVVQRIDSVELRSTRTPAAPAEPITSAAEEERAARERGTRVFALLLDEFHVNQGADTERVRAMALKFVEEEIRPADLLLVMKPLDSQTGLRFSRDRDAARAAIAAFEGRKGDFAPRTSFERQYLGHAPEAVRDARAQIVTSALRAITMRLGELDAGRSAIVVVSDGFVRPQPRGRDERPPQLQGIVRAASRYRVAVYAFTPGIPAPHPPSGSDADPGLATLQSLAVETGGEAVFGDADLLPALARVARDLDAYYLLTYTSTHPTDGRFYGVEIKVKRTDAQVRARSGYWAPLRSELVTGIRPSGAPVAAPMRVLRRSPLIETWLGLTIGPDGRTQVLFTWQPASPTPGKRLTSDPRVVSLKAQTPDGQILFEGQLSPASGERMGLQQPTSAVFDAPPGKLQLDLVVLRADGSRADMAAADVDVPDVSKAEPVILPPQVFTAASAREFRELSEDPAAAPEPGREFRRTDRLLLRVPAYAASGAPVTVTAQLVNRQRQVLRALPPMPSPSGRGVAAFDVPLGWLAPGEYAIELTATTSAGSAKETIRFRLRG